MAAAELNAVLDQLKLAEEGCKQLPVGSDAWSARMQEAVWLRQQGTLVHWI